MYVRMMVLAVLVCAAGARAELLLSWNFDGNNNAATPQSSDYNNAALVNSAILTGSAGFVNITNPGVQGSNAWNWFRHIGETTIPAALAAGDFFAFTVVPAAGGFYVTSVVFAAQARENVQTFSFGLFTSADSFASQLGPTVTFTSPEAVAYFTSFKLSITFDQPVSEPTEFRLAVARAGAQNLYAPIGITDFDQSPGVNGFEVHGYVPEPAGVALAGLGVAAALRRRAI